MVQERLGHATITMTMDVYGHLFPLLMTVPNSRGRHVGKIADVWGYLRKIFARYLR